MNESTTSVKYYLLMIANPYSDSKAAVAVFKNIRQLDLVSGKDIDVYFPGFHKYEKFSHDSAEEVEQFVNDILLHNHEKHEDYHGKSPIYHTFVESAGDIYFNEPDFYKFVSDFEALCPTYEYWGRTELILLPTVAGEIQFHQVQVYNLEPFFSESSEYSLEEFIMSMLKIMKVDTYRDSQEFIIKATDLYARFTCTRNLPDATSYTDIVIRLDNEILSHMNWKKEEEAFFISYSTKDEFYAYSLKSLLEKYGKLVWMAPEGIPSGSDYACAIPAAIRVTSRFVVLLSHNSARSNWVRREIAKAIDANKRIDGVFIRDFTLENIRQYDHLDFLLENVQLRYALNQLTDDSAMLTDFLGVD